MNPIVILGTGNAGYTLARTLRRLEKTLPIVLVTRDGGEFYSKPMLSSALREDMRPEQLATQTAESMAAANDLQVLIRTHVQAIRTAAKQVDVTDRDGKPHSLGYSKLVLALGADTIRPPIFGDAAKEIITVNDLDDYRQFREALKEGAGVLILGAGLIGCEFANDLVASEYRVDVVDLAPLPLARLLPPECGAFLRDGLASAGVNWSLDTSVARVDRNDDGKFVAKLSNGKVIEADLVLSAIGIRPRTALAQEAGLKVERGIVVDTHLQTSAADVYALGDCAEINGMVLPYILPIQRSVKALASTLAGKPLAVAFPAMPVIVKTPACPVVVCPPAPNRPGKWNALTLPTGIKAVFVDPDDTLLGYALVGQATSEHSSMTRHIPAWTA